MPPSSRSSRKQPARRVVVEDEDEVGSGQSAESLARDIEAQPELLAAAAARVPGAASSSGAHANTSGTSSTPTTPATVHLAGAKKKKRKVAELIADLATGGGGGGGGGGDGAGGKRKGKKIEALIKLATHQQGPNRGKLSGRALYTINCAFEENKALQELVLKTLHQKAAFYSDFGKWAVRCPSKELALKMHAAILADPKLRATAKEVNRVLNVSPYDNAAIVKPHFVLAESEVQFETAADGVLPRSIMIVGKTYDFKEFLKDAFPEIRYLDLLFNGGTVVKSAWVLPVTAQTEATGTLAAKLRELGVEVEEENLDEGEDDSEEDDERDDEALVDGEAEEAAADELEPDDDDDA